jgi:2-polyprenyl-3-methyl-5-hydroxy-6-metoxy-1,4-benzoquinol methylase
MNWEETIKYIRNQPEYSELVEKAYFDENLPLNVERFRQSEEYKETLRLFRIYVPNSKNILDIGCGNGISSIAFALDGYTVTACEPDPSNEVGAGAVKCLKEYYSIKNLEVYQEYAEKIDLLKDFYDIVYVRQAMHHAYDLNAFIQNIASLIKPEGILITVRDHVIYDAQDKKKFLDTHPLQKYYGGENAFTEKEYTNAIELAGLKIEKIFKHYDTVINYYPLSTKEFYDIKNIKENQIKESLRKKISFLCKIPFILSLYKKKIGFNFDKVFNESEISGRMYTYIARK